MLQVRSWYRPVAPVVAAHFMRHLLPVTLESRHMQFAPKIPLQIQNDIPGAVHVDGTSRIQTLSENDDGWLFSLLMEVGALTGWPIVLNTSFNVRGRPLANALSKALATLQSTIDLHSVIVEDWSFSGEHIRDTQCHTRKQCNSCLESYSK